MAATDVLLAEALRRDPVGPLITFYDDASGERTELSATTLANWVAKTGNFITEAVGLEPGTAARVALPLHWQTAVVLLAGWSAGLVLDPAAAADTAFVTEASLADDAADTLIVLSLRPLGLPCTRALPAAAWDYAADVREQGDRFVAPPLPDAAAALAGDISGGQLLEQARSDARTLGITAGDRIAVTRPWTSAVDWRELLLAPLAAGASLVLTAYLDPAAARSRHAAERVTATLSRDDAGSAVLHR